MSGPTAGQAFPQWGCIHQLCVYPSSLAHPSACTGSLFSLPALLRGLRSTESRNPSGLCVCVHAVLFYTFSPHWGVAAEEPKWSRSACPNRLKELFPWGQRVNMCSWVYGHATFVHILSFRNKMSPLWPLTHAQTHLLRSLYLDPLHRVQQLTLMFAQVSSGSMLHLCSWVPHCVCPPSAHGDRWADPLPLCRWDHYWGEKTLSALCVWLLNSAPAANKNSSRGTRISDRPLLLQGETFPTIWYNRRGPTGWGDPYAGDVLISLYVMIVSKETAQHPRNNERNFCNTAHLEKHDTTTAA